MNNIIITGGSRGIGFAIAKAFAAEGGCQLIVASKNQDNLSMALAELNNMHPTTKALGFAADLAAQQGAEAFGEFCLAQGTPHILVNNAGAYVPGNVVDEEVGALQKMLNTNLLSAWYLTRKIAPAMVANKSGHIFNISSIAGLQAYPGGGAYSISKYAMNGFNDNLRLEMLPHGVKVTNVLPGAVMTDSWTGFDNSNLRIMEAGDIAKMVVAASKLSIQAVVETIVLRPQLGDL